MAEKQALFYYPIERFTGLNVPESDQTRLKPGESPYMKNFRITDTFSLEKRDGYTLVHQTGGDTRAVFVTELDGHRFFMVSGTDIYMSPLPFCDNSLKKAGSVGESENCFFVHFAGSVYLWGGGKIQVYDAQTETFSDIEPYSPLVAISCDSEGAGTPYEGVNLLTGTMRKLYSVPKAGSSSFMIGHDQPAVINYVKYKGELLDRDDYSILRDNLGIDIDNDFWLEEGINTVEICYTISGEAVEENLKKIINCRYSMFYGGENDTKVFLWGNPDYPDTRFWSEAADGMPNAVFFAENNFTRVGDGSPIRDIIRQYDRQLIFCDKAAYLSYIETKTDALGRNYFSFPVRTISDNKGSAVSAQTKLVDNFPVTLCRDGLYRWVSTAQRDERNVQKLSTRIDNVLMNEDISSAKMYDHERKYELYIYFPGGRMYIYNYRTDVFFFYDGIDVHTFFEDASGNLYFCDPNGNIFAFKAGAEDNGKPIDCIWHSGYMDLNYRGYKNLYHMGFTYRPDDSQGSFDIGTCCESDSDMSLSKVKLPPAKTDADKRRAAKNIKHRLRTKRFHYIKLAICGDGSNSKIHIRRISLNGRYTNI